MARKLRDEHQSQITLAASRRRRLWPHQMLFRYREDAQRFAPASQAVVAVLALAMAASGGCCARGWPASGLGLIGPWLVTCRFADFGHPSPVSPRRCQIRTSAPLSAPKLDQAAGQCDPYLLFAFIAISTSRRMASALEGLSSCFAQSLQNKHSGRSGRKHLDTNLRVIRHEIDQPHCPWGFNRTIL